MVAKKGAQKKRTRRKGALLTWEEHIRLSSHKRNWLDVSLDKKFGKSRRDKRAWTVRY